ncbi:hypothetical protein FQN54_006782 [Arachnomyces sp. PD_36]|nr:hypothetical protein FQN54_006782 [Arachnomyces sp. PD_36]
MARFSFIAVAVVAILSGSALAAPAPEAAPEPAKAVTCYNGSFYWSCPSGQCCGAGSGCINC